MKRLIRAFAVLLLIPGLAACGGGGGGGGGGVTPGGATYSDSLVSYQNQVGTRYFVDGTDTDGFYVERTADGITVYFLYLSDPTHFPESSFTQSGNFKISTVIAPNSYSHSLYLGGQGVGLEYSEFGLWRAYAPPNSNQLAPLYPGNPDYKAKPALNTAFTGNAVANYHQWDAENGHFYATHTGTAQMQYTGGAQGWTLDLLFPGAFNIQAADITIGSGGDFAQSDSTKITVDTSGGTYGAFTPDPGERNTVAGQFYGADGSNASEAVGYFDLDSGSQQIMGAFGVKK